MNKFKLFIENFFIYGFGGIIGKIIPLIMVPVVTRMMPETSYYGISDLSNTVASFGSAIAGLGLYDAMYRMFFEKEDSLFKKDVCSTTLNFAFISSVTVFLLMIVFKGGIARVFFGSEKYSYLIYITAFTSLVSATNNIIAAPTRMQNNRRIYLLTNTISPLLSYIVAIVLIQYGYYIVALPIGALISGLTMEVSFYILNHKWFKIGSIDKVLLKQLLKIGLPLLPNFLIYWIFNSSDKIMIVNFLSANESGIYSVGSKLGHASQLIYTAFAGGWQYFAFSTMKEKDQVNSNSLIFEYLAAISFIASIMMCSLSRPLFNLLFTGEYVRGYVVAPYLFLAPLLQMLLQVSCNQFVIIKTTWPNMFILSFGAAVNIVLNYSLIPFLGIEGAAIATLVGYALSVVIAVFALCKIKLMLVSKRLLTTSLIVLCFYIVWSLLLKELWIVSTVLSVVMSVTIACLYEHEIRTLINRIQRKRG